MVILSIQKRHQASGIRHQASGVGRQASGSFIGLIRLIGLIS
jgi:hypothetical protein